MTVTYKTEVIDGKVVTTRDIVGDGDISIGSLGSQAFSGRLISVIEEFTREIPKRYQSDDLEGIQIFWVALIGKKAAKWLGLI